MKASSKTASAVVMDGYSTMISFSLMGCFSWGIKMGLGFSILKMEITIRVSIKIINFKEKECIFGKVKLSIKGNLIKAKGMVMAYGNLVIRFLILFRENIQMITKMDMGFIIGLMVQYSKEISLMI
jgi:hypothetical protein